MDKNAVITLAIGYQPFWAVTHPTIQRYAERIGADFIVIDSIQNTGKLEQSYKLEKFQLYDYLDAYERVVFLDSDIVVHPQCPNLFDQVSKEKIGAVCEKLPYFNREEIFKEACTHYGATYPGHAQDWFNTGMMVLSRCHRHLFSAPQNIRTFAARNMDGTLAPPRFTWLDMPLLNCLRIIHNVLLQDLGYSFNYMQCLASTRNPPGRPEEAWIFHGTGEDKSSLFKLYEATESHLSYSHPE
jgi:Glycosyl transferase family 8